MNQKLSNTSRYNAESLRGRSVKIAACVAFALLLSYAVSASADIFRFETDPPPRDIGERWVPGESRRFDLNTLNFTQPANNTGPGCSGYISEEPTVELNIEQEGQGTIRVESNADPVMVLENPDGEVFCIDDFNGLNPGVAQSFSRGLWRVWVGSYSQQASFPYTLVLE